MVPPRIFGSKELAARWGVTKMRVSQLAREDPRFPKGEELSRGRAWGIEEIEEYERVSGRKPKGEPDAPHDTDAADPRPDPDHPGD